MRSLIRLKGFSLIASTAPKILRFIKDQRKTFIILINLIIYSLTSTVVVLEEMFRETLQTLACLSVLAGAYSLHMSTRDSYRNPLNGISLVHLNDEAQTQIPQPRGGISSSSSSSNIITDSDSYTNELSQTDADRQTQKHLSMMTTTKNNNKNNSNRQQSKNTNVGISLFDENNEIPDYPNMMSHEPIGPLSEPRGLQELFSGGTAAKYDIRLQQQQQQHTSKRSGVGPGGAKSIPPIPHGLASQLMLRSARGQRQYDVPQIGKCLKSLSYVFEFGTLTLFIATH